MLTQLTSLHRSPLLAALLVTLSAGCEPDTEKAGPRAPMSPIVVKKTEDPTVSVAQTIDPNVAFVDPNAATGDEFIAADGTDADPEPEPIDLEDAGIDTTVKTMVNEECASAAVEAVDKTTVQPADIIIAIDTSSSMGDETEELQRRLSDFSQQIVDSGIDVRVILISQYQTEEEAARNPQQQPVVAAGGAGAMDPAAGGAGAVDPAAGGATATDPATGGADAMDPEPEPEPEPAPMGNQGGGGRVTFGVCVAAPLGSGACPEDENLPIFAHVNRPVGSTDILEVIMNSYGEWGGYLRLEATTSFLIISDDDAETPAANFTTGLQGLSVENFAEWTFNGIFSQTTCEASENIGTVFENLVTQTGGVSGDLCQQDFQPVFDSLAEQIILNAGSEIACEWDFPTPPDGQTFSADLVEVERTTDLNGTVAFERVPTVTECGIASWYYDDPVNPTKILACPATCEAMQAEEGGQIEVKFGCEKIDGCAASSAAAIGEQMVGDAGAPGDAGGVVNTAMLSCEFPLPPPPDGVILDYATINVRYATPAGFGVVLGIVPTAADCANVESGWYYDDPEEPTSVNLCPSTCTEYQAGNVVNVQALFGCASKPAEPVKDPQ